RELKKRDVFTFTWLRPPVHSVIQIRAKKLPGQPSHKAQWEGDNNELVNVEELVLQHYKKEGWKGYHSENSIIMTLFGLLFFDILFDDAVPGVFASAYQVAPLDLGTEFFFTSREKEIERRLDMILQGKFVELICSVDDLHRPQKTFCVGVNWDKFSRQDILEISECIGGQALSQICRLFAQTYWAHTGGVPDLCIWNKELKKLKLVEVKGDSDRLSEKQKIWLDFLGVFGVDVVEFKVKSYA
ncbi:hypothetical protein HK096_001865, partial [Nowakowskiella sp. JEL0078]